jgi:hypothetical protein
VAREPRLRREGGGNGRCGTTTAFLPPEDVARSIFMGTWLVTLSAYETGSGEARAGEGVLACGAAF